MIKVTINGKNAVPALSDGIRVVRQNPVICETEGLTMDLTFPMDILDNVRVFGRVNLIAVSKASAKATFQKCSMSVNGRVLISGTGTVTAVTDKVLKLQIRENTVNPQYGEKGRLYIDECLSLGTREQLMASMGAVYVGDRGWRVDAIPALGFPGVRGVFCLACVRNADTDGFVNEPDIYRGNPDQYYIEAPQPQLCLMRVMEACWRALGYTVRSNAYDRSPWNDLYVASAEQTGEAARGLPHWTVERFLDEFRKLFNARYRFEGDFVDIAPQPTDESAGGIECHEVDDEFETDFEEEGSENIHASSIGYSGLSDKVDEVKAAFRVVEFESAEKAREAGAAMTKAAFETTVFGTPDGLYYGTRTTWSLGHGAEPAVHNTLTRFGEYERIERGEDRTDLCIIPVSIEQANGHVRVDGTDYSGRTTVVSVGSNGLQQGDEYVSVKDVVDGEKTAPSRPESDTMAVFFCIGSVHDTLSVIDAESDRVTQTITFVAPKAYVSGYKATYGGVVESEASDSMRLTRIQEGENAVGAFHSSQRTVENRLEYVYTFITDAIPDPLSTYIFRGKRYECRKIELTVREDGIDRKKKGYFYEIL